MFHFSGINHDTLCGLDGPYINLTNILHLVGCQGCLSAVQQWPCGKHQVKFCAVCWTVLPSDRLALTITTGGNK